MNMRALLLFFYLVLVAHCAQAALPTITGNVTITNVTRVDLDGAGAGTATADCSNGFVIGSGVTVTWAVTVATVKINGPIGFANDASKLTLTKDLLLGVAGMISHDNFKQVFTGKFAVRDTYGNPLLMTIDDDNYDRYKNGFTIPLGRLYEWAATKPVNGPIVFTAD